MDQNANASNALAKNGKTVLSVCSEKATLTVSAHTKGVKSRGRSKMHHQTISDFILINCLEKARKTPVGIAPSLTEKVRVLFINKELIDGKQISPIVMGIDLCAANSRIAYCHDARLNVIRNREALKLITNGHFFDSVSLLQRLAAHLPIPYCGLSSCLLVSCDSSRSTSSPHPVMLVHLLNKLREMAEETLRTANKPKWRVNKAFIALSHHFTAKQENVVMEAARLAGFDALVCTVNEHAAAFTACLTDHLTSLTASGKRLRTGCRLIFLVAGFDASTFEASVIEVDVNNGGQTLLGAMTNREEQEHYGKFDCDCGVFLPLINDGFRHLTLYKWMLGNSHPIFDQSKYESIGLGDTEMASIELCNLLENSDDKKVKGDHCPRMSRLKYETPMQPFILSAMRCIRKLLKLVEITPKDIEQVFLIGPCARSWFFQIMFILDLGFRAQQLGLMSGLNPTDAVVRGAAIVASKMQVSAFQGTNDNSKGVQQKPHTSDSNLFPYFKKNK